MHARRKGFTLVEILIVVIIVGILALAAIPVITGHTRDARRSEAAQLLGAARDYCRAEYSKTNSEANVQTAFTAQQSNGAFSGQYYNVATFANSSSVSGMDAHTATDTGTEGTGTIDFAWASGTSQITWS